jgi:hypothetical protein
MTARVVPLASPEAGDPRMGGTVDERVAAVAILTEHAWALAGRSFPSYSRANMPVVLTTLAAQADGD